MSEVLSQKEKRETLDALMEEFGESLDEYSPLPKRLAGPTDEEEELAASPHGMPVRDMMSNRSKWNWTDMAKGCMAVCVTGSYTKAERLTGVPKATLRSWKLKASWWPAAVDAVHKILESRLDSQLTGLMTQLLSNLTQIVTTAEEEFFDHKTKSIQRRPVSARDTATIFAILHDKRALMRGNATTISGSSTDTLLSKVERRMEAFAKQMKDEKVVSEQ